MSAGPRQAPYETFGANVTKLSRRDHGMGYSAHQGRHYLCRSITSITVQQPVITICDDVLRITEQERAPRHRPRIPGGRCTRRCWRRCTGCHPPAGERGCPGLPMACFAPRLRRKPGSWAPKPSRAGIPRPQSVHSWPVRPRRPLELLQQRARTRPSGLLAAMKAEVSSSPPFWSLFTQAKVTVDSDRTGRGRIRSLMANQTVRRTGGLQAGVGCSCCRRHRRSRGGPR